MSELQERNRAVWSSGDWDRMASLIKEVGPRLLDAAGVEPGMDVLDVGTGSGTNIAVPAAQRGAQVVGLDLTDQWFDAARGHAADAGVEVEWVEGDAEQLPFQDASFDRVFSTFGHMFAPDHRRAAEEMLRVCRPGGVVGFTTWLPTGYVGRTFALMGSFAPPPPEGMQVPPMWGKLDHVRAMVAPHEPEFTELDLAYEFGSAEELVEFFSKHFGPAVTLAAAIGAERAAELDAKFLDLVNELNEATDGTVKATARYLQTIIER